MVVFLLVLGSFIAAAGLGLVATGVSFQAHTFDASNLTPGMIAVIGGCILIGLGIVVRALLRVERALIRVPVSRPARAGEVVASIALAQESEAAGIPFPAKPKAIPQTAAVPMPAMPPPVAQADAAPDALQTSDQERLETTPVVEASDVSLLPKPPARADEDSGEVHHAAGRANGSAHAVTAPRVAANGRPIRPPQAQAKGSIFDALWPKQQRAAEVEPAPTAESTAVPPAIPVSQQAEASEPSPPAKLVVAPQPDRAVVSVLKSGVVEGMAYTLFSDGSIEAQLPGGTLRFGSITELRNHIEHHG